MYVAFKELPDNSRIWVYQADKNLTIEEEVTISLKLKSNVNDWAAHGAPLMASFQILMGKFIIMAVNEQLNAASGCSIDASTHWLKEMGKEMNIDFFDRKISYLSDNIVYSIELPMVKPSVMANKILPETVIFNNLVNTIGSFKQNWQQKAEDSWLKKYFIAQTV